MLYSFDVYDTIITRKVYEPKGIWDLMSFYLLQDSNEWDLSMSFKIDFAYIRSDAEKQARRNHSCEITIDDIYNVMKNNFNLSGEICTRLRQLEIECELNNTVIIKENIEKIKKLKESSERIILISDMYLPKNFFVELFDRICPMLNSFKLYLSSDTSVTKASGLMYEYVSKQEGVNYSEWIHEGDNIVSDVNVPELYGISTIFYHKSIDINMKRRLEDIISYHSPIFRQYLLGIINDINSKEDIGYRIGYGFVGIALYAYVEWILNQAEKRKIKRLYFIARDGFILKKIADIMIKEYNLKIKTFYLYGSRNAWRIDEDDKRKILKQYLEQEFFGDYSFTALVDTQGSGRSVEILSHIIGHKFTVFYYTLLENGTNRDIIPISYCSGVGGSIIEVLCRAPHGSTVGYVHKDGKIVPKLLSVNESAYEKANYFSYIKGVEDFTKDFVGINRRIGDIPKGNISEVIVRYCLKSPDRELADFLGEIPFNSENENKTLIYAPKLTKESIRKIELERVGQKLNMVYTGDALDISYLRLDSEERDYLEECKQQFIENTVVKSKNALKIIIYGYGIYGKELYHRMHLNSEIEIVDIVDVNYQRFLGKMPIVNPIKNIKMNSYDLLVVSLYDEKISEEIRKMLISSGIKNEKIIDMKEFERKYESYNKHNSTSL